MRRMVVVLREESPGKRAFSPGPMAPERRFADLMADRAGVQNSSPISQIRKQTPVTAPVDNQRFSPMLANRIRELASDVRRIGRGRRCDAESIAIDKDWIAVELGRLAGRLDRRAAQ